MTTQELFEQLKTFLISEETKNVESWIINKKNKNKKSANFTFKKEGHEIILNFRSTTNSFVIDPRINKSVVHHLQLEKSDHLSTEDNNKNIILKDNFDTGGGRTLIPNENGAFKDQVKKRMPKEYQEGIIYKGEFNESKVISAILNWSIIRNKANSEFPLQPKKTNKASKSTSEKDLKKNSQNKDIPNLILYGPPGTGKTFSTIDIASDIITNGGYNEKIKYSEKEHKENTNIFNDNLHKRIHFLTFHQNYSYEEFVGGLRPVEECVSGNLQFSWEAGVFMKACVAAFKVAKKSKEINKEIEKTDVEEFIKYCNNQKELDNDFNVANKVVLIIDEINRANISRVFGELITLIEDDKRIGGKHQLILSLPNGIKFGVPGNLVIIGTMNTADKSIALLDIALRRRFEFIQMKVRDDIVDNEDKPLIDYKGIMNELNKRIEEKKNSQDYNIGHSYFIGVNNVEKLKHAFNKKIIPLLNEYFMGDIEIVKEILESLIVLKKKESKYDSIEFESIKNIE